MSNQEQKKEYAITEITRLRSHYSTLLSLEPEERGTYSIRRYEVVQVIQELDALIERIERYYREIDKHEEDRKEAKQAERGEETKSEEESERVNNRVTVPERDSSDNQGDIDITIQRPRNSAQIVRMEATFGTNSYRLVVVEQPWRYDS